MRLEALLAGLLIALGAESAAARDMSGKAYAAHSHRASPGTHAQAGARRRAAAQIEASATRRSAAVRARREARSQQVFCLPGFTFPVYHSDGIARPDLLTAGMARRLPGPSHPELTVPASFPTEDVPSWSCLSRPWMV
jgi:hypothetical protein